MDTGIRRLCGIRTGAQKRDGDEAGGTWGMQTRGGREPASPALKNAGA